MAERCVCCGAIIPEGRQVCPNCQAVTDTNVGCKVKLVARPWQPQDLLDDLQRMIDEQPDNYLNADRTTLCEAKAFLEEHFAKPKWIPVTERLPESGKCVLVCSKDGMVAEGSYKAYEKKWTQFRWNVTDLQKVTHWMPLPEPPKGE